MKKTVNDLVSSQWAKQAKQLLTGCYPDITTFCTRLYTLENQESQDLKTEAARQRLAEGTKALIDSVKYGWAFGLNETQALIRRPAKFQRSRRIRALIPLGIALGQEIGANQRKKILSHAFERRSSHGGGAIVCPTTHASGTVSQ